MSSNHKLSIITVLSLMVAGSLGTPLSIESGCPSSCISVLCSTGNQDVTSYITITTVETHTRTIRHSSSAFGASNGTNIAQLTESHSGDILPTLLPDASPTILQLDNAVPPLTVTVTEFQTITQTRSQIRPMGVSSPLMNTSSTDPENLPTSIFNGSLPTPVILTITITESGVIQTTTRTQRRSHTTALTTSWNATSTVGSQSGSSIAPVPAGISDDPIDSVYTITITDIESGTTRTHPATRTFTPRFHNIASPFSSNRAFEPFVTPGMNREASCTSPSVVYQTSTETITFQASGAPHVEEPAHGLFGNGLDVLNGNPLIKHFGTKEFDGDHVHGPLGSAENNHKNDGLANQPSEPTSLMSSPAVKETSVKRWYRLNNPPPSIPSQGALHQRHETLESRSQSRHVPVSSTVAGTEEHKSEE